MPSRFSENSWKFPVERSAFLASENNQERVSSPPPSLSLHVTSELQFYVHKSSGMKTSVVKIVTIVINPP